MTCRRRCVSLLLVTNAVAAVSLAVGPAKPVDAHAFLIRTTPAQGERLDSAPDDVSLEFSETFDPETARLELTVDGDELDVSPQVGAEGRVLRSDIAADRDGMFVVSWEVTGSDGHETAGEFAFGVRTAAEGVPAGEAVSPPPEPLRVVAGGVFFAGLALAVGSIAAHWAGASPFRTGVMGMGLVLAVIGALVAWADAQVSDEPARQRLLLAATAVALMVALQLFRLPRRRWPAAIPLAVAAATWSARGHGAVINGVLGGAVDVVHSVAGAAWVGALVLFVVDLRREDHRGLGLLNVGRRYARLAAVLVIVLAAAGAISALLLLESPSDLWATGYGQALTVKTGLVVIALGLAAVGRRALTRKATERLRQTTPFEAAALVGVLAVTALLVNLAPPGAATVSGASLLGPPPIRGAVARDGGLAGQLTVAVTANTRQLRVEVFAPGGRPAADAEVELDAELPNGDAATLVPRPCGPGCFTQRIALPEGSTRLNIAASDSEWASGLHVAQLDMPPPPNQPELLTELTTTMQSLPKVRFTETTTSGPGSTSNPDTFELAGSRFVELEPWAAGTADDIQALVGERGFRMYLPGDRIWITVWQDDQGRIARERIVSLSHEIMREDFDYPAP